MKCRSTAPPHETLPTSPHKKAALYAQNRPVSPPSDRNTDAKPDDADKSQLQEERSHADQQEAEEVEEDDENLLFRCISCKRPAHWICMPFDKDDDSSSDIEIAQNESAERLDTHHLQDRAQYYQSDWKCDDCDRWTAKPDVILAWRPFAFESMDEKQLKNADMPSHRDPHAPVEYYIKWQEQSYRRAEWVPHAFCKRYSDMKICPGLTLIASLVAATSNARLRNFLERGSELRDAAAEEANVNEDEGQGRGTLVDVSKFGKAPNPRADEDIPRDWVSIDRVINCTFKSKSGDDFVEADRAKNITKNPLDSIGRVYQALVKWQSLPYSECAHAA